ncbi:Ubiquitin conjugation factor E4 A, partial [Xenoophorus captivus]
VKCVHMILNITSLCLFAVLVEDSGESQSESENSVSDSVDENDDSVAEISRSFRSRQELWPEEVVEFVGEVIAALLSDQEVRTFEEVIVPVFDIFQGRIKDLDLCQPLLYYYLDVLLYFSHHKDIAKVMCDFSPHFRIFMKPSCNIVLSFSQWFLQVLMEHIQPKDPANGLQYQKSLLGMVLNISCLLRTPGVVEGHGYFLNPSRSSAQETKVQEANIHQVYCPN